MIKINDDSIVVGQIKQLLHNFNLPMCYITKSTDEDISFLQKGYMIKDTNLYYRNKLNPYDKWKLISPYSEGKSYLNLTNTLDIESKYYDINTHIYLGKYLRFLRDYHKVNLMSMYNCSISKTLDRDIFFTIREDSETSKVISWNITDNDIYVIPINPTDIKSEMGGVDYTIYVNNSFEVTPVLYNIQKNTVIDNDFLALNNELDINSSLYEYFHKKVYCQSNSYPYLYNIDIRQVYSFESDDEILYDYKDCFCLLIKVPKDYSQSIVVLEGDYTNESNSIIQINKNNLQSLEKLIPSITKPQLLSNDNNSNYLLADRLIEYLTDNVISNISKDYDILKLQSWLSVNKDYLTDLQYSTKSTNFEYTTVSLIPFNGYRGVWSSDMTYNLIQLYYYYINNPDYNNTPYYDFIGYCDSTMEKLLESLGKHDTTYDYGGIV